MSFDSADIGIRQLHARCADAVWRKDAPGFAQCFTQDGEWKIAGRLFQGRAAIIDGFLLLTAPNERIFMQFGTPALQMDRGQLHGRTYVTELVKRKDGKGMRTLGAYYETFVAGDGCWLFARRQFDMFYYGTPDLADALLAVPDYGPPPGMPPQGNCSHEGIG